jgi:hypothetical protein
MRNVAEMGQKFKCGRYLLRLAEPIEDAKVPAVPSQD